MRVLEIASVAGLLLYSLLVRFFDAAPGALGLVGLISFTLLCHAAREGWRWQMAPAYFLAVMLIAYEYAHWVSGYQASSIVFVAVVFGTLTTVIACVAMPVFKLPMPTGPHAIGTETLQIVDHGRREPFSDDSRVPRELVIQIWYPAMPIEGRKSPYRDRRIATLKSSHFRLVETHSIPGAHPCESSERFPVLLYTPSWSGTRTECTIQIEEMASHGYVVVAIDHPYCSSVVLFPDGRVIRRGFTGDEDYSSDASVARFIEVADQQVRLRSEDARFVIDTLGGMNFAGPVGALTGKLAMDNVGIFGFSLGGATAAQACLIDRRFKAGADLGGMIAGDVTTKGIPVPFLFMFEGVYERPPFDHRCDTEGLPPEKRREVAFVREQFTQMKRALTRSGGYWMIIEGIRHRDLCDAPFFSPLRRVHTDPHCVSRTVGKYLLAYFNRHIRGTDEPLLATCQEGKLIRLECLPGG